MESIVIDYRHPAFSIISFLLVIAVVALISHLIESRRRREEKRNLSKFLSKYEQKIAGSDYQEILKVEPSSVDSFLLLASIYFKSGDYSEATRIYIALLEIVRDKTLRIDVMNLLAKVYYKAGFLERSKNTLLESLSLKARNEGALELLSVIYELTREYDKALEVLVALEELGFDVLHARGFLLAERIVSSHIDSDEKKAEKLIELWQKYPFIAREVLEFLLNFAPSKAWGLIKPQDIASNLDLFWFLPAEKIELEKVKNFSLLEELYTARGLIASAKDSSIFELDILIALGDEKNKATLEFEYSCKSCLISYPLYFHRCPNCFEAGSSQLDLKLIQNRSLSNEASANFH